MKRDWWSVKYVAISPFMTSYLIKHKSDAILCVSVADFVTYKMQSPRSCNSTLSNEDCHSLDKKTGHIGRVFLIFTSTKKASPVKGTHFLFTLN